MVCDSGSPASSPLSRKVSTMEMLGKSEDQLRGREVPAALRLPVELRS